MSRPTIEILDRTLAKVADIKVLYPIDIKGNVLKYSDELSDYGQCTFRVSTKDPIFETYGDVLIPHRYHIRIRQNGSTIWQGAIIDNNSRNKNYIEVNGAQYEWYFIKKRIKQNTSAPASWDGGTDEGWRNYRNFESGTMAAAVTAVVGEAITGWGTQHILGSMTVGTVDNPDYPAGLLHTDGTAYTGAWSFDSTINVQFDYHSLHYVLQTFGVYSGADYEITNSLVFNFREFIGSDRQYSTTFEYGTFGNIIDYDLPRLGKRMTNDLLGIAADDNGNILHISQRDPTSINTYGLLEDTSSYSDVKTDNILRTRLAEELRYIKEPDDAPVNFVIDEKINVSYSIGDIVTVKIKDNSIDFNKPRRIIGITTLVHNTGKKIITIQTNKPKDNQYGVA